MRARGWRLRFEGSQVVGHDGPGAILIHTGAWHAGFGRTVGLSEPRRDAAEGEKSQRGVGHKKKE